MSEGAALEALAELQGQLEDEGGAARDVVVGVLALVLGDARGCLPELEGRLGELNSWAGLRSLVDAVAERRGRALIEAEALCVAEAGVREAALGRVVDALLGCHAAGPELLGTVYEAGRSGARRRRGSTHYTPSAMASRIVARALEPALGAGEGRALRICDPAMGSGVFLLEACRQLAPHVAPGPEGHLHVASSCVYGVDEDPRAVALARLSLWLECGNESLPWTCFDHNLRCGDALVGVEREQLARVHWDLERGQPRDERLARIDAAQRAGAELRQALAKPLDGQEALVARGRALTAYREQVADLVALGDGLVAAFLSGTKVRAREAARHQLLAGKQGNRPEGEPRALHWWLAFPELEFGARGFDVVVGNPPFLGKNSLLAKRGRAYLDWLKQLHPGSHGNADYAAHFFRRAAHLIGEAGTIGLVATNTIAQGDTRETGLAPLVRSGWRIYEAAAHLEWPGAADVTVSIVHLARGRAVGELPARLDGRSVDAIDSRLRPGPERPEPAKLAANRGRAFIGTYVLGQGFVLDTNEREALIAARSANAERIRPYIGGGQLNRSPTQASARYVIDFGTRTLAEAEAWPELLERIREQVKPQRDRLADNADGRRRKRTWWQHGRVTPSLEAALAPLERCIATSLVNKHLCFAFQPSGRLFSHKLCVFPFESAAALAVLQSRIHLSWAWLLSSTMRNAGINYSPSDCFETFPLPEFDAELEAAGAELDARRASYMRKTNQGLTQTYNALADAGCQASGVRALRAAHEAVDRAVLAAYGWSRVAVPPYLAGPAAETFEREVLDRLFALNVARAD